MSQREIVDAIEEELRISSRFLRFTIKRTEKDAAGVFRVFIDPMATTSRGLDDNMEGALAWWPGQPPGRADVLSVAPERDQINLRFLTAPPPQAGLEIRVYPPRYLEALRDLWESTLHSTESLNWLERFKRMEISFTPDRSTVIGFPKLRERQRQAFDLLEASGGFLWGPPGTGKTYTVGAMLASFLCQHQNAKVLLLSTTNTAVDLALLAVDQRLEELEPVERRAATVRPKLKRIGSHFTASSYRGREHLLPVVDPQLVSAIAQLEAEMPEKSDAAAYASWKDKISALRAQVVRPLDQTQLAAMTTTSAAFQFERLFARKPFDLIVFDEASQISLPHAVALAPLGKKAIFAGDHQQLAPIVVSDHPVARRWLGASMFNFMTDRNRCFLNEQSRMAEEICDVVSRAFYNGELSLADGCEQDALWRADRRVQSLTDIGYTRVHIEKCSEEGSFRHTQYGLGTRFESAQTVSRIAANCASQVGPQNVLVLTPYRAQRNLIRRKLGETRNSRIRVSTVHRAQGGECHTVIFDPVIATGEKLLGNPEEGPRLINVALSRAKARLILVMSAGDYGNEYLRRITQIVGGVGQFDDAVPIEDVIRSDGFPSSSAGQTVRWGNTVGSIERADDPEFFYINDFLSGEKKKFKTELVKASCGAMHL